MGTSGGETTTTTGEATSMPTGGAKLDVAAQLDLGIGELDCEAVDFLFVIDNSSSMAHEQEALIAAVPGFTAAIVDALPGVTDIRVGVVDTDSYPALGTVDPLEGCPDDGTVDCTACDYTLGALLTRPRSAFDPATDCGFADAPWMDARANRFAEQFACVADVGIDGNQVEQQAGALVAAVSPALQTGGCNDGFLRDNALLIFLLLTDEEDDHANPPPPRGGSEGNPSAWHDALVAAKGGLETNVVALGLIGGSPLFPNCEALSEEQGAEPAPRLTTLLESFDSSYVGSVCASNYESFFADALMSVARGCAQFVPG
jgi:hypothetical protein